MTEEQVRQVLLVQAIETRPRTGEAPPWSAEDAAAASAAAVHAVGEGAAFEPFVIARAREVLRRLAERVPGLPAAAPAPGAGAAAWAGFGAAGALALGVAADAWGAGGRIQLLALPLLGLLGWNLLVYAGLAWSALRRPTPAPPAGGGAGGSGGLLVRRVANWLGRRWPSDGPRWWRAALAQQALLLQPVLGPVRRQRVLAALHAGAALVALGLLGSLYARGLVLDFRAGWDSTFLDARAVHALLQWLFAPAAAWPGLALPDVDQLAALRWADGSAGAPAADWIHRIALTVFTLVVFPRLLLAAVALGRARRAASALALPPDDAYLAALRPQAPVRPRPVTVLPFNCHDSARAPGLGPTLARWLGPGARPRLLPVLPLGAEDRLPADPWAGADGERVVLMALNATPEREHHGVLLAGLRRALPPGARCAVLLDAHAFDRRLAGQPDAPARRADRTAAWQALVAEAGLGPAEVADLGPAGGPTGPGPAEARAW